MSGLLAQDVVRRAAQLVVEAEALLVTAGAGLGVDSGLPDFRSPRGFWRAYPPLERLGLSFEDMAQPRWFDTDPALAWAFYGHRLQLYRRTRPHAGYTILKSWCDRMPAGGFVLTSNVDGQFFAAGFPKQRVVEQHGSIHRLQCTAPCCEETWPAPPHDLDIDMASFRAVGELPRCGRCGALARPNILMFADDRWIPNVTRAQRERFIAWLEAVRGRRVLIVECGAGTAVAAIRYAGERIAEQLGATLVRINPEAGMEPDGVVPVPLGALEALRRIERAMRETARA
ncbi:MAG TPA: Sir2 family NAD-dependent protein deacetylase [Gammaproteobacteria bacterium]